MPVNGYSEEKYFALTGQRRELIADYLGITNAQLTNLSFVLAFGKLEREFRALHGLSRWDSMRRHTQEFNDFIASKKGARSEDEYADALKYTAQRDEQRAIEAATDLQRVACVACKGGRLCLACGYCTVCWGCICHEDSSAGCEGACVRRHGSHSGPVVAVSVNGHAWNYCERAIADDRSDGFVVTESEAA